MFDLNPLGQFNAWWQHLIMLLGAGILGYIIGYRKSRAISAQLEEDLHGLTKELDGCRNTMADTSGELIADKVVVPAGGALAEVRIAAGTVASGMPDNLKLIEGIGPKIEQLLHQGGIFTFRQLSHTSPDTIQAILRAGGPRFQMHNPASWPRQAALAADDKWEELSALQNELNKGRTV